MGYVDETVSIFRDLVSRATSTRTPTAACFPSQRIASQRDTRRTKRVGALGLSPGECYVEADARRPWRFGSGCRLPGRSCCCGGVQERLDDDASTNDFEDQYQYVDPSTCIASHAEPDTSRRHVGAETPVDSMNTHCIQCSYVLSTPVG
jgi:hypothetical protein